MSTAETPPPSLEIAVGEDGAISVPADEVARLGLRPGTRLWLVADQPLAQRTGFESVRGALAHCGPAPALEDFEKASELAVAEHESRYAPGGRWGSTAEAS